MKIMIGADPEFFLKDKESGKFISAHGLVPGDKKNPYKPEGGAVQLDGTAIEFNINPAGTAFEFEYNITKVLDQIRKMVPNKYEFVFQPSVEYDKEYWDKHVPETSKELGCDPDFNANHPKPTPNNPPKPKGTMRTGAGHIHVGWVDKVDPLDQSHYWDCTTVVKDLYGLWNGYSKLWDKDSKRFLMYGNGPVFRPKPYGTEFRTPSNAWLNYPKLWPWLFEVTKTILLRVDEPYTSQKANRRLWEGLNYEDLYSASPAYDKNRFTKYNTRAKNAGYPLIPEDWDKAA